MSITLSGRVEKSPLGINTWALVADDDQTYEIHQPAPSDLLQEGLSVQVEGSIRQDVMTLAMIGPVLEITHFEKIT